jgi:hypothetical protein
LILLVDPRLVDTLVEHAKTGHFHTGEHAEVSEEAPPVSIIDAANYDEDETD